MADTEQHDSSNATRTGTDPGATPGWRLLFARAGGLRAGWRLILFAVFFYLAFQLFASAAYALHLPMLTSRTVLSPTAMIVQEAVSILATFVAAFAMALMEGRSVSAYGLPLRGAFGGRFWMGCV